MLSFSEVSRSSRDFYDLPGAGGAPAPGLYDGANYSHWIETTDALQSVQPDSSLQ